MCELDQELTHEAAPQRKVVLVTACVDGGKGVQDLLEDEEAIFEVVVLLQPLLQRFACTKKYRG